LITVSDIELLIDLVFHGEAVTIPPRTAGDTMRGLAGVACYDIFDGAGEDVAVVGEAGGERGTVVEGVFL
jgi:hypothetical protein